MLHSRVTAVTLLSCLLALRGAIAAKAATPQVPPQESIPATALNLEPPGARSLALGGAFIGLADDATAAYANPAGLTNLSRPEISAEGRHSRFTNTFPDLGHAFGDPTGTGFDNVTEIRNGSTSTTVDDLSFLSVVYPFSRGAIAIYRHEIGDISSNTHSSGIFISPQDPHFIDRLFPTVSDLSVRMTGYDFSGALRLNDKFSLGAGVTYYDFSLHGNLLRYDLNTSPGGLVQPGGFFGPPDYDAANLRNFVHQAGSDHTVTATVGALLKVNSHWELGAVYRQGHNFNFTDIASVQGPSPQIYKLPAVYGAGTSIKPTEAFTVNLDYDRVAWKQAYATGIDSSNPTVNIAAKDSNEVHLGLEYAIVRPNRPVFSLRVGTWFQSDSKAAFQGTITNDFDRGLEVLFPSGKDVWHYSGGLGLAFGERFQVDAAYDSSEFLKTFALSAIFRF